jgi:hypothetical protein
MHTPYPCGVQGRSFHHGCFDTRRSPDVCTEVLNEAVDLLEANVTELTECPLDVL